MGHDSEGAGKELDLTLIKKHILCARHSLFCLHTPPIKAHEGRNCYHRFSDGETEAHGDEGTGPRSLHAWWSQGWNLGTCTITHVLRFLKAQNRSSLQCDNNSHSVSSVWGGLLWAGLKAKSFPGTASFNYNNPVR